MSKLCNKNNIFLLLALSLNSCVKNITPQALSVLPERARFIINEQQNLSRPVIELMRLSAVPLAYDLSSAVSITQKSWLRKSDNERSDIVEEYANNKGRILQSFASLGLLDEVKPERTVYDYLLVLGSTYESFIERLSYVERLLTDGYQIKHMVFLGSERPLDQFEMADLEPKNYAKKPGTEIEMMKAAYENSKVFQKFVLKISFLSSLMKIDNNGKEQRANTYDTLIDLQKLNLVPGSALVISSQPHILRQDLVVRSVLKDPWHIESVGPRPSAMPSGVLLDELARTLYELKGFLAAPKTSL